MMPDVTRALRVRSWPLHGLTFLVAAGIALTSGQADTSLSPGDAIRHVGELARVCGLVASTKHAVRSKGQPTFLDLGTPYPDQEFTVVIWSPARAAFTYPPESLQGQTVCIRGTITTYRGKAQIVVADPAQVQRTQGP
jgi:hypothetical protein